MAECPQWVETGRGRFGWEADIGRTRQVPESRGSAPFVKRRPPLSLYYMQGLNLTALHAHTALFGVYGMLGIGLVLFCLRGMRPDLYRNEKVLKISFWSFNLGLALMALLTLLPLGTLQLLAAINHGYWYARSAEFMQQPIVELLIWMRVPGDTIFSIGALALVYFVISLWLWPKSEPEVEKAPGGSNREPGAKPKPAE